MADLRHNDLRLDHIGIQAGALEETIAMFCECFGYRQATSAVVNTRHRVEVVFLEKAGSVPIKLIRPLDTVVPPAARLHHVAFHTDVLDQAIATLQAQGARLLSPPAPGEAFENEPIAFLFVGGLNVELITTDKRRNRIDTP